MFAPPRRKLSVESNYSYFEEVITSSDEEYSIEEIILDDETVEEDLVSHSNNNQSSTAFAGSDDSAFLESSMEGDLLTEAARTNAAISSDTRFEVDMSEVGKSTGYTLSLPHEQRHMSAVTIDFDYYEEELDDLDISDGGGDDGGSSPKTPRSLTGSIPSRNMSSRSSMSGRNFLPKLTALSEEVIESLHVSLLGGMSGEEDNSHNSKSSRSENEEKKTNAAAEPPQQQQPQPVQSTTPGEQIPSKRDQPPEPTKSQNTTKVKEIQQEAKRSNIDQEEPKKSTETSASKRPARRRGSTSTPSVPTRSYEPRTPSRSRRGRRSENYRSNNHDSFTNTPSVSRRGSRSGRKKKQRRGSTSARRQQRKKSLACFEDLLRRNDLLPAPDLLKTEAKQQSGKTNRRRSVDRSTGRPKRRLSLGDKKESSPSSPKKDESLEDPSRPEEEIVLRRHLRRHSSGVKNLAAHALAYALQQEQLEKEDLDEDDSSAVPPPASSPQSAVDIKEPVVSKNPQDPSFESPVPSTKKKVYKSRREERIQPPQNIFLVRSPSQATTPFDTTSSPPTTEKDGVDTAAGSSGYAHTFQNSPLPTY